MNEAQRQPWNEGAALERLETWAANWEQTGYTGASVDKAHCLEHAADLRTLIALVADRAQPDPYLAKCANLIATLRQIGETATAAANNADFQNVPPPPEPPK